MNKWDSKAFLDDDKNIKFSIGIEVIRTTANILTHIEDYDIFVGIGNNATREKGSKMKEQVFLLLIHPNAVIGEQVDLKASAVIMAGAIINCCSKY
ncbi:hypothetical protein [Fictibacillus gelatini]|uniref:PglD-related sugar-binding protein n=1 Tax=Fictibacillus gelatini TaxID=225985 RepID=UPI002ADE61D9|nr:hypothetical protein [Fictibacillus gelatini]